MDNMTRIAQSKSSFSIENILEQKSIGNTVIKSVAGSAAGSPAIATTESQRFFPFSPHHHQPHQQQKQRITTTTEAAAVNTSSGINLISNSPSSFSSPSYAFKNLANFKSADSNGNLMSTTSSPPLHFEHVYDPATSMFYQQFLSLQKNSTLFMPHFQAAAAAAAAIANAPSAYCEPSYNPFLECDGFSNTSAATALYCNAAAVYPGFYMSNFGVKRKGGQIRFTTQQTKNLENRFASSKYLSPEERRHLALQLKLTDRQVKTWFQNRRAKWRRSNQSRRAQIGSTYSQQILIASNIANINPLNPATSSSTQNYENDSSKIGIDNDDDDDDDDIDDEDDGDMRAMNESDADESNHR